MGAIGGPCIGHLSLSHVALMEASAVGQLNSLPSISQTWAPSPGWNLCRTVMWEWCGAEQIAENDHKAKMVILSVRFGEFFTWKIYFLKELINLFGHS